MLIELTITGIVSFVSGMLLADILTTQKTNDRLRKRGYVIEVETNYYRDAQYRFVYTYFDKHLNAKTYYGPYFDSRIDAIANADAHYYAKILNGGES